MWSVVKHLRLPCVSSNTCIPGCLSVHQFSNRRQMCFPWTIMTASKAVATSGISRFYTTPCSPWTVFSFSSSAPLQLETLQQEFFLEQRQGRSVDKPICQTTNWWLKKDRSRAPVTSASVCISFSELMKVSRTTLNQLACSLHYSAYSLMEFDSTTGEGDRGATREERVTSTFTREAKTFGRVAVHPYATMVGAQSEEESPNEVHNVEQKGETGAVLDQTGLVETGSAEAHEMELKAERDSKVEIARGVEAEPWLRMEDTIVFPPQLMETTDEALERAQKLYESRLKGYRDDPESAIV